MTGGLFWHLQPEPQKKSRKKWLPIDPTKLKLICAFAYGFMTTKALGNVYNLLTSCWIDSPKGTDKPKDWRSKTQRIRPTSLDIMYVNFVQKMGVAHVLNPVACIQSDAFVSDVTNYGEKTPSKPYKHFYFYNLFLTI